MVKGNKVKNSFKIYEQKLNATNMNRVMRENDLVCISKLCIFSQFLYDQNFAIIWSR